MKEADLVFGEKYAIDRSTAMAAECWTVVKKEPAAPGKSRSRMYVITQQSSADTVREERIDAGKILMPWSEYEKTPAYAQMHFEQVTQALHEQVGSEVEKWWDLTHAWLLATVGGYGYSCGLPSAVPVGSYRAALDLDTFLTTALSRMQISMPLAAFIKITELPLPDTASVEAAIEQRVEITNNLHRQRLPHLEATVAEMLNDPDASNAWELRRAVDDYAAALDLTDTPGPHPTMVKLAKQFPQWDFVHALTERQVLRYLIQYLEAQ